MKPKIEAWTKQRARHPPIQSMCALDESVHTNSRYDKVPGTSVPVSSSNYLYRD